jgi:hypothetical protein
MLVITVITIHTTITTIAKNILKFFKNSLLQRKILCYLSHTNIVGGVHLPGSAVTFLVLLFAYVIIIIIIIIILVF